MMSLADETLFVPGAGLSFWRGGRSRGILSPPGLTQFSYFDQRLEPQMEGS